MNDNIETLDDLNDVIKALTSSPEDNARFGKVEAPKEIKTKQKKLPNKKDSKIIKKIWATPLSTVPIIKTIHKFNMEVGRCISISEKMTQEECIDRIKKYKENLNNQ